MDEVATLETLESQHGYLRRDGDSEALITNAAAFTRHAAWALRDLGWGNVRKTSGEQREGLDVDKILNKHTLEMRDIVIAAGSPAQRVGWLLVAHGTPTQWVEPKAPPGVEEPEPEPVDPDTDLLEHVADRIDDIEQHTARIVAQNDEVLDLLRKAAARLGL